MYHIKFKAVSSQVLSGSVTAVILYCEDLRSYHGGIVSGDFCFQLATEQFDKMEPELIILY